MFYDNYDGDVLYSLLKIIVNIWLQVDWKQRPRSAAEFFTRFTPPKSSTRLQSRMKCNVYYYRTNYVRRRKMINEPCCGCLLKMSILVFWVWIAWFNHVLKPLYFWSYRMHITGYDSLPMYDCRLRPESHRSICNRRDDILSIASK